MVTPGENGKAEHGEKGKKKTAKKENETSIKVDLEHQSLQSTG
jgi:hypothetical protein